MMFPDCTDAGVSPKMLDPAAGTACPMHLVTVK
jgi:hypothetical protein